MLLNMAKLYGDSFKMAISADAQGSPHSRREGERKINGRQPSLGLSHSS